MSYETLLDSVLNNIWPVALLALLLVAGVFLTVIRTAQGVGSIKSSQPAVLITGPAYAGKTSLYKLWTSSDVEGDETAKSPTETVMSQIPNVYKSFKIPFDSPVDAVRVTLVDLPGHKKLSHHLNEALNNFSNVKGIIFMLDAASGPDGIRAAAESLFKLLLRTEQRNGGVDLMIACNKADVFNVIPAARIKTALEEEIQAIRATRAKGLGEVANAGSLDDDNDDDGSWLGGETFQFANLDCEVSISDGSVATNNVEAWKRWVEEIVVN